MPTASEFLRAIEADFDDDTPRLVYADWLDETGDPDRAAFIRLQCERERLLQSWQSRSLSEADREHHSRLWAAERALLDAHRREWAGYFKRSRSGCTFHRGFPYIDALDARRLLLQAGKIRKTCPLGGRLSLHRLAGSESDVFASEHLACVTQLVPPAGELTDEGARYLVASPYLGRVRRLELGSKYQSPNRGTPLTDVAVAALAAGRSLPALRELNLFGCVGVTAAGVRAILESRTLRELTQLDIGGPRRAEPTPDFDGLMRTATIRLTGLQSLGLSGRAIGDAGAVSLSRRRVWGQLAELNLCGNYLTDAGALAVLTSKQLGCVTRLDLSHNKGVTAATAHAIIADPRRWEMVVLTGTKVPRDLRAQVNLRWLANRHVRIS